MIDRLRRIFGLRKVGHAGTLDPMATGLLVVAAGRATPLLHYMTGLDKEYEGEITFGARSSTYDAQGKIEKSADPGAWPPREIVAESMRGFEGDIEQIPPAYSAIKVGGRKLYEYARKGEEAPVAPRAVKVDWFRLASYEPPLARFGCRVSSGTYVRSLAHDLGGALGCGGYLSALRRTRVGAFYVDNALTLEMLEGEPDQARSRLIRPADSMPHLARIVIGGEAASHLRNGGAFSAGDIIESSRASVPGQPVAVVDDQGRLLAVCQAPEEGGPYKPLRVIPQDD